MQPAARGWRRSAGCARGGRQLLLNYPDNYQLFGGIFMKKTADSSISETLEAKLTEAGQRLLDISSALALLPGTVADLELLVCPADLLGKVAARLPQEVPA